MTPLSATSSLSDFAAGHAGWVVAGLVVFVAFFIGSRLLSRFLAEQLHKRHLPAGTVVIARRVLTVLLLVVGLWAALGFAIQSANVTLLGILLATVIASFGVQDLLKDYVSGYYVLLERHIRVGDRITMEGAGTGTVLDVKLRVTLLQTDSGDLVVVPNSEMFGKAVTVHARAVERVAEAKVAEAEAAQANSAQGKTAESEAKSEPRA
jgi:small-conductance mechanosensitive channel